VPSDDRPSGDTLGGDARSGAPLGGDARSGAPLGGDAQSGAARPATTLGVLLLSGSHDRAHYAFVVASGAAALGRTVVLFATNRGCIALCRDWSGLTDAERDERIQSNGVAGLDTLREACLQMEVRMIACEAGLRAESLDPSRLLSGVEVAGIATFLSAIGTGQVITI
jgi:peroxiredoxin family protein